MKAVFRHFLSALGLVFCFYDYLGALLKRAGVL